MLVITPTPPGRPVVQRCATIKASRPALIDLRFKGDAWVVVHGSVASVCLGDYSLGELAISPLDLQSLNRTLTQIRMGQARRNYLRRIRKLRPEQI